MKAIDRSPVGTDPGSMGDIGKPERIVEDEPISWPDEEPLTVPAEPLQPAEPVPAGATTGASGR
ncbi:hypothetical protein [Pseudofrankia sp. EUN1h]|uniref:hypothetical protein n=1 Tax=Pseudofrankia sp. EUN1h TaxID=1834515 RepID=UPI0002EBA821|nr:hypothetical protein [Pseudofrankia sp. EUN1h]OHV28786.1 hypothetical protein BCD49_37460 [Pseudofrankia sp. EUN1h]